jgi:hypothetical protein
MAKQKKIFISRDQQMIDQFKKSLDIMLPNVESIVTEFNKLKAGSIETSKELQNAYEGPVQYYSKKRLDSFEIPDALLTLGLNKTKLDEMRDNMPSSQRFYAAVEWAQAKFPHQYCSIYDFDINSDGEVEINQDLVNAFIETYTVYAETDQELKLYNAITEGAKALENLRLAYKNITGVNPFEKSYNMTLQSDAISVAFLDFDMVVIGENQGQKFYGQQIEKVKPNYKLIDQAKRNQIKA